MIVLCACVPHHHHPEKERSVAPAGEGTSKFGTVEILGERPRLRFQLMTLVSRRRYHRDGGRQDIAILRQSRRGERRKPGTLVFRFYSTDGAFTVWEGTLDSSFSTFVASKLASDADFSKNTYFRCDQRRLESWNLQK